MLSILLAHACLHLALATDGASSIRLPDEATTPGNRIRLRDLLSDSEEKKLDVDLLNLDLGRAPSPGFGRSIDRRLIESLAPNLKFDGATATIVRSETVTIDSKDIEKAARELLDKSSLIHEGTTVELTLPARSVEVAKGRDSRKLVPKLRGAPTCRGPVSIQIDIEVDGQLVRTAQVGYMLRTKDKIAVLKCDLPRGQELTENHFELVMLDTTNVASAQVDPTLVIGQMAKHDLKAGAPLRVEDFAPDAIIRRGDNVRILYRCGGLELESRGTAKSAGALGESIRVENADSKKTITARVAGPGLVVIQG